MKIYVEFIIILVLMLIFIAWRVWFDFSRKKLLKEYSPDKDISQKVQNDRKYKGGVFKNREGTGSPEQGIETAPSNSYRPGQLEKRKLFQKTAISNAGKNSSSTRKNSSNVRRRFFKRKK